jgi:hypothetical protein
VARVFFARRDEEKARLEVLERDMLKAQAANELASNSQKSSSKAKPASK